jgi:molecular chaperone HscB
MDMNYFELFEIPVQLKVEKAALSKRFFELSRAWHPDRFINEGAQAQAESLDNSAQLNRAFKIFQNPDETIKYVLKLKGLLEEEEKYELPPAFLMEVLEINEQLMDLDESAAVQIRSRIRELEIEIYEPVKEIIEHYKEGATTEKELLQVKDYYYKKKYLDRIQRQLDGMN